MPNRVRPRCTKCNETMSPVYKQGRLKAFSKIPNVFFCKEDGTVAKGRKNAKYV